MSTHSGFSEDLTTTKNKFPDAKPASKQSGPQPRVGGKTPLKAPKSKRVEERQGSQQAVQRKSNSEERSKQLKFARGEKRDSNSDIEKLL